VATEPGDAIVFVSDGILDAENAQGEMYGQDRLARSCCAANRDHSAQQIADAILADVTRFQGEQERFDDETIIVLKVRSAEGNQRLEHRNSGLTLHVSVKLEYTHFMEPPCTQPQERIIRPAKNVYGSLRLPGDKSISHRYGMLAAFAEGTSRFTNFSTGRRLRLDAGLHGGAGREGAPARRRLGGSDGRGRARDAFRRAAGLRQLRLDDAHDLRPAGAAGGALYAGGRRVALARPMERIRKPLAAMGARLTLTEGHAPLTFEGGPLKAIDYTTPVPSAQVKTCILLAGLQTEGTTTVREAVRTRDHSELALRAFGAKLTRTLDSVSITGPQTLRAIEAAVPGDISSAAFFLCAAALFPGSSLVLDALGLNPRAPRCWTC
jgi:hypothetical protein